MHHVKPLDLGGGVKAGEEEGVSANESMTLSRRYL